jgi:TonB-linked SusC/RagA family outer membrane protein
MRKTLLTAFLFLCCTLPFLVFAQSRQIKGKVTNENGEGLPAASVLIKGTQTGVLANNDGAFTISITGSNVVMVVSSAGLQSKEIAVGSSNYYSVVLSSDKQLSEVVVTGAFGIKQRKKTLGYNVQEVSSQQLAEGKQNNFIDGLQGKISGVNITSAGGAPGAGTDIVIRGLSSLNPGANNQPLIIIDGMPVDNSTITGNVLPSSGTNSNQAASRDQFAFANRGLDINPDDIESISVLKGAGATALYGLKAANGALIITTKRGKSGQMLVNFNSYVGMDFITKYPEIQTKYREGQQGRLSFNTDGSPNRFQTFGPLRTAGDPVYKNFRDAFDKGTRYNNSISVQGGNDKTTYYSSFSSLNQKGIVPASKYDRYTFKLAGTSQISSKFSVNASATFTSSDNISASAGDKGFMTDLAYYSPTFDVNDYLNADGSMKVFSPGVIDNPIYSAHYSQLKSNLFRTVGNMGFTYNVLSNLKIDYKIGGDFYNDNRTRVVPGPRFVGDPTTLDLAAGVGGYISEDRVTFRDVSSNLFITYNNKIGKDLDYSVLVGNTTQSTYSDLLSARGEKFALPFFYDLSNTANLYNSRATSRRKYTGIFADVKFGFRNALFLELTGRNDWSSTLPPSNNSFFYPSASLSYVFTDLPHISGDILSFGKLRLSYSQVGKDAPPYSNGPYFVNPAGFPFNTTPGSLRSTDYSDPALKPEMQQSIEVGTELHFLKDRILLDVSWYRNKNVDQIIPVPIAYTSGYNSYITNAGSIQNQGVEVQIGGSPIKLKDFIWNVNINWSTNKSKVLSIKQGISEIAFYDEGRVSNKLVVGGSAGDLYGYAYRRDASGNLLINAQGFPDYTPTFVKSGNAFPRWIGSMNNSFTYKGFTLSGLLELRKGGDVFDVTMRNFIRNGVLKITENRYQQTVFKGIKESDGKANDISVVLDQNFYRNPNFFNNITDVILQDASWIRLRNVSLAYQLPKKWMDKTKFIIGANVNLTASNFILWTPYKGYDPQSSAFGAGYNVYGYTGSNIPNYSSFVFTLNLNF